MTDVELRALEDLPDPARRLDGACACVEIEYRPTEDIEWMCAFECLHDCWLDEEMFQRIGDE